jgi:CRISPR-associated protein Cmr4
LFFNLGFLTIEHEVDLTPWIPTGSDLQPDKLVVVGDNDIALLHDMGLYRQSRVALGSEENPNEKKVRGGAFFNVEALPEGSVLIFPVALKKKGWKPFGTSSQDLYFGGLESIGFGHCRVTLQGDFQ